RPKSGAASIATAVPTAATAQSASGWRKKVAIRPAASAPATPNSPPRNSRLPTAPAPAVLPLPPFDHPGRVQSEEHEYRRRIKQIAQQHEPDVPIDREGQQPL